MDTLSAHERAQSRMETPPLPPREKLIACGAASLSDRELITVLLGTGTRNKPVARLAEEVLQILDAASGSPDLRDLRLVSGLGAAKSSVIAAALEYARRMLCPGNHRIRFPADVVPLVHHYADRKQEHFLALSLNGAHEVSATRVVSVGLVNRALVHPREVFAEALEDRAAAVIVAHNHPSGNVEPSPEDREVTARLQKAGRTLGIAMLDHVIFARTGYYSFLEQGEL
ncbi:MAG: RadC family protein [Spirochaetaceae bacterium]